MTTENVRTLGKAIVAAREEANIDSFEVARALNVTHRTVRQWENDEKEPVAAQFFALVKLLPMLATIAPTPQDPIGVAIRRERERARISQRSFARKLSVSHVVVYRWEHGESVPNRERMVAIASILPSLGKYVPDAITTIHEKDKPPPTKEPEPTAPSKPTRPWVGLLAKILKTERDGAMGPTISILRHAIDADMSIQELLDVVSGVAP